MNVVSPDISDSLREATGWEGDIFMLPEQPKGYSLGYLIRKMPNRITTPTTPYWSYFYLATKSPLNTSYENDRGAWGARYGKYYSATGHTPEDAVANLVILLVENGLREVFYG